MVAQRNQRRAGICLLTPPLLAPMVPSLAMPTLAGYLSSRGVRVRQIDLNVRFHNDILNESGLFEAVMDRLQVQFGALDGLPFLEGDEPMQYLELLVQLCQGEVLQRRRGVISTRLRAPMPHLEALPFGYPNQREAFQMIHLATSLLHTRPMALGRNVGVPDIPTGNEGGSILREFYGRHLADLPSWARHLFGVTVLYDSQLGPALAVESFLRERFPGCRVVVGGAYVRRLLDEDRAPILLEHFDFIVAGEGEEHLLQLCLNLSGPSPQPSATPRLVTAPAPVWHLTAPVFSREELMKYWSNPLTLLIQVSRGCYWDRCAFCSYRECYSGPYRCMAPQAAAKMIAALGDKHGCRSFEFADDCLDPLFLQELMLHLKERAIEIRWSASLRFDERLLHGLLPLLARAGCRRLTFGMESASQRVLDFVNKGTRVKNYVPILEACKENGIDVHLNWIAGLPTETAEELQQTVDFLRDHAYLYTYQFGHVFTLEAASLFALHPERFGLPPYSAERRFHTEAEKRRLSEIIRSIPLPVLDTLSCIATEDFTGWSPFVAERQIHYDLAELTMGQKKERMHRLEEDSVILFHTLTNNHIQLPTSIVCDIKKAVASASGSAKIPKSLGALYENEFVR